MEWSGGRSEINIIIIYVSDWHQITVYSFKKLISDLYVTSVLTLPFVLIIEPLINLICIDKM